MTALDVPQMPSCPLCGEHERVQKDRFADHHVYLCGGCNTVFAGGQDEWHRYRERRERFAGHRRNQQEG